MGFQPSYSFTHIHQIKAYNGDDSAPIITLTPRYGNPDILQLIHVDSKGKTTYLASTPLAPFLGTWVEAYEKITYGYDGQYSIVINRLSDGTQLFAYSSSDLDLWRNGTTVVRPKWGIYRSLDNAQQLRDEQVRFDRFCLAKGTDDCPSDQVLPDFSLTANAAATTIAPGESKTYPLSISPLRGFTQGVSLRLTGSNAAPGSSGPPAASNLTGLPAASTASFTPSVVTGGSGTSALVISTSTKTPPGNYTVVISARSADGILSHVVTVPLVVEGVPGDVNRDGAVDCADLVLVRRAFGTTVGQAGYNPSADFNGDGIINIQDLAFAAQRVPAAASCP